MEADLSLSVVDISANLDNLADPSLVGADRNTKLNDCFADIASLSEAVKDASTYIPPYDQRSYSNVRCRTPPFSLVHTNDTD